MAVTSIVVLSNVTVPVGTTVFGPIIPPLGSSSIQVAVDRALLTSVTLTVNWAIELSRDSGATWLPWGGAGAVGGTVISPKTGLPYTESTFAVNFDLPTDAATRVRGSITSNEIVVTTVTVRVA